MQKIILPGIVFIFLIGCSIRPVISPENQEQYLTSKELDSVNEYYTNEDEYIYSLGLTKNAYGLEKDIYNAVLRNPNITPSDLIDQFEDQYNLLIVILLTESMSVSCEALDVATRLAILFKDDAASGLLSEMYISLEENRIIQTAEVSRIGNYLERIYPGFPSV
nr:hypothetical protein [Bacteroidota bacterium]